MHIVFIAQYYYPETGAASERITGITKGLVARGHSVTVITGLPNYPSGKLYPGFKAHFVQRQSVEGVDVIRTWLYFTERHGAFLRLGNYLSFMCSSFFVALFVLRPEVIVATSGPIFSAASGCVAAMLRRVPFVLDVRDIWPERIYLAAGMKRGLHMRLLEKLELFLYRHASRIVTVTEGMRKNIIGKAVPSGKVAVISNGVDTDIFNPKDKISIRTAVRKRLGLTEDCFIVIYAGTLGLLQDTSLMVEVAARVSAENIKMLIVGNGAMSGKMKVEAAEKSNVNNLIFSDSVSREELRTFILASDLGINANIADPHVEMSIPVKLFPFMACGLPILIANRGEIKAIIEGAGAGKVVEPGDVEGFVRELLDFSSNPELGRACAEQGKKLVQKHYTMLGMSKAMESVCNDVVH